ncbi:MAG: FHA domain-containing protein [Verrucomicrobiota bacterium]
MPRVTITVPEKNAQPYRFQLDREVVSLGRGSENDIAIDSGSVSVLHAEMRRIEGGYELHDVGSTNGIKLDGERHQVIPLRSGATVKIGDVSFDFVLSDEEREALARERPTEPSPITREQEFPPMRPLPKRAATYSPAPSSGGTGVGAMLLFVILAAAAFFAGLAVRYNKETGGNLIEAVKAHRAVKPAPAAPAPAGTIAPAPDN